ncbi:MAG: Octaprenyl diphosphate synthase [Bacteroidetes bacterium]|nr:Octaprenyl diphosphate synthase [Bacteroidota bacterium]
MAKKLSTPVSAFFPPDWPKEGPIDLNIHDLPHISSTTEWWYMHSHIKCGERNFSLFASFFKSAFGYDKKTKKAEYGYSVIWAISDLDKQKYHTVSLVDRRAPKIGIERIKKGQLVKDPHLKRAALEMLEKGVVPYPDELLTRDVIIASDKLHLDFDGNTFTKKKNGNYVLHLDHKELNISADLEFTPQKPPTRHGDNGVVRGVSAEDMFYYFIPRNEVKGKLNVKGEKLKITSATGWYDHEFGAHPEKKNDEQKKDVSWNWIAVQLSNGCELSAYDLIDLKTGEDCGSFIILIDEKGNRHHSTNYHLKPVGEEWTSTRTFNTYPTMWELVAPDFKLDLKIEAAFPAQEFATVISKPAFWEGRMNAKGKMRGRNVTGPAFIERHGFVNSSDLNTFLKAVSKQTLKSVRKIIPLSFGQEKFEELISKRGNKHLTENIDKEAYINTFIKPIREITDRSGKSWRSYATIACCDVVGGNSQVAIDWLALPELMHVGSLMVDDVQDESTVRRGGPTAHVVHGQATAINSGTAAYFLGQICIYEADMHFEEKVQVYNWYFEAMRASHSGQAMDIKGLDYMMPEALVDDNVARLLSKRVLATHRLKSAAPASYLAQIGALIGGASKEQIAGLGDYYEKLGIAFQIIDDTLNLKGFKDHLKTKAEDITAGKITYPIAVAMAHLDKADRKKLWKIVSSKTSDIKQLSQAVALLDKHKVIEKCEREARTMLDKAWWRLDPLIKDSMVKLNMRAFGWFVLERTY